MGNREICATVTELQWINNGTWLPKYKFNFYLPLLTQRLTQAC